MSKWRLLRYRTLRVLGFLSLVTLGFRFAPPQADMALARSRGLVVCLRFGCGPGRAARSGVIMKIDIDGLTEAELIDLNNRVVERLKFLNHMRAHAQMLEFRIGDRVSFQPEGRPLLVGMLTRYNKKTVTVITDSGQHWNVAPGLLRRVNSSQSTDSRAANVIQLHKK
jgi:hypothetical protein